MFKKSGVLFVVFFLALLPLGMLQVLAAPQAATRYVASGGVDSANDCTNANNPCGTVVYAVQQTDAGDTVEIASGSYTETDTIRLFRDVTINGAGLDQTTVSVQTVPSVELVFQVFADVEASITNLTLRNAEGAGVQNNGNLALDQVRVVDNRGVGDSGGINNAATGIITITDSLINENGTGVSTAAGMINYGQATIQRSLFMGNKASSYGGGVHNQGQLVLENVTFTQNEADSGTAVSNGGSGQITMTNVTIAQNMSTLTDTIVAEAVSNYGTSIQAANTLIADNGPNAQCVGDTPLISLGNNLDGYNSCNFNQATDISLADARLDALTAVTGTPNWVPALSFLADSPALDAGSSTLCPATDARGVARPIGGGCDIGAYEFDNYKVYLPMIVR